MLAPDNRIKTVMGWNDFISKITGLTIEKIQELRLESSARTDEVNETDN